ncbi:MAG: phage tail tip lysozyme [Eubacteriales bacterium]|nr:phage tail tip lysozyme [Eubacteriales bacterium]
MPNISPLEHTFEYPYDPIRFDQEEIEREQWEDPELSEIDEETEETQEQSAFDSEEDEDSIFERERKKREETKPLSISAHTNVEHKNNEDEIEAVEDEQVKVVSGQPIERERVQQLSVAQKQEIQQELQDIQGRPEDEVAAQSESMQVILEEEQLKINSRIDAAYIRREEWIRQSDKKVSVKEPNKEVAVEVTPGVTSEKNVGRMVVSDKGKNLIRSELEESFYTRKDGEQEKKREDEVAAQSESMQMILDEEQANNSSRRATSYERREERIRQSDKKVSVKEPNKDVAVEVTPGVTSEKNVGRMVASDKEKNLIRSELEESFYTRKDGEQEKKREAAKGEIWEEKQDDADEKNPASPDLQRKTRLQVEEQKTVSKAKHSTAVMPGILPESHGPSIAATKEEKKKIREELVGAGKLEKKDVQQTKNESPLFEEETSRTDHEKIDSYHKDKNKKSESKTGRSEKSARDVTEKDELEHIRKVQRKSHSPKPQKRQRIAVPAEQDNIDAVAEGKPNIVNGKLADIGSRRNSRKDVNGLRIATDVKAAIIVSNGIGQEAGRKYFAGSSSKIIPGGNYLKDETSLFQTEDNFSGSSEDGTAVSAWNISHKRQKKGVTTAADKLLSITSDYSKNLTQKGEQDNLFTDPIEAIFEKPKKNSKEGTLQQPADKIIKANARYAIQQKESVLKGTTDNIEPRDSLNVGSQKYDAKRLNTENTDFKNRQKSLTDKQDQKILAVAAKAAAILVGSAAVGTKISSASKTADVNGAGMQQNSLQAGKKSNLQEESVQKQAAEERKGEEGKKKNQEADEQKKERNQQKNRKTYKQKIIAAALSVIIVMGGVFGESYMNATTNLLQLMPHMASVKYDEQADPFSDADAMTQAAYATLRSRMEGTKNKLLYGSAGGATVGTAYGDMGSEDPFAGATWQGKKYTYTDDDIVKLTRKCLSENGYTLKGVAFEMCQILNQHELNFTEFSDTGLGLVEMVKYNRERWWGSTGWNESVMASGTVTEQQKEVVRRILNGTRVIPLYINEHDCWSDISSYSNGSRSNLIPNQTVIHNRYGSTWTFYAQPSSKEDPFGYTKSAVQKAASLGYRDDITMASGTPIGTGYDTGANTSGSVIASSASTGANGLTVERFLEECQKVCDWTRGTENKNPAIHHIYGNSLSVVTETSGPCEYQTASGWMGRGAGYYISCDRLIARALWQARDVNELFWKDQTPENGGHLTCGNEREWLTKHGWTCEANNPGAIQPGSIILVSHVGTSDYGHTFVVSKFDQATWTMDSYDQGSDDRIYANPNQVQPEINRSWSYNKTNFYVFNLTGSQYDGTKNLPDLECRKGTFKDVSGNTRNLNAEEKERISKNGVTGLGYKKRLTGTVYVQEEVTTYSEGDLIGYEYRDTVGPDGVLRYEQTPIYEQIESTEWVTVEAGTDTRDIEIDVQNPQLTVKFIDNEENTEFTYANGHLSVEYDEDAFFRSLLSVLTAGTDNDDGMSAIEFDTNHNVITLDNYDEDGIGRAAEDRKTGDISTGQTMSLNEEENEKEEDEEEKRKREFRNLIKQEYLEYACDLLDAAILKGTYEDGNFDVEYTEVKDNGTTTWTDDNGNSVICNEHYHLEATVTLYAGCNPLETMEHSVFGDGSEWNASRMSMIYHYFQLDRDTFWELFQLHEVTFLGGSGGALTGVAREIYNFLHGKGLSDVCIAGILGNMAEESGGQNFETINPAAVQSNGVGHGIIQWSGGRWNALQAYAASRGMVWSDLKLQLEYLWKELFEDRQIPQFDPNVFAKQRTPRDACVYFWYACEVQVSSLSAAMGYWESHEVEKVRIPEAERAYQMMQTQGYSAGMDIVAEADKYVGKIPYVFGGESLVTGCDCSAFAYLILKKTGHYHGPRFYSGYYGGESIDTIAPRYGGIRINSLSEARAGDIVRYQHHIAIYDGKGLIVEAQGKNHGITHEREVTCSPIISIWRFE